MPKITVERAHALPQEEIKKRLQSLADKFGEKYGVQASWKSPTVAEVKRTGASGTISCEPGKVCVALDLSFALTPIKGKVEERIKSELDAMVKA